MQAMLRKMSQLKLLLTVPPWRWDVIIVILILVRAYSRWYPLSSSALVMLPFCALASRHSPELMLLSFLIRQEVALL